MTDKQRYLFDLQGFLLVEDVLDDAQCEQAKTLIAERVNPMAKTPDGYDARGTWFSAGGLLEAGEPFRSLIDHPKIVDVLHDIIGSTLRLESAYSFVRHRGCPPFEMHGGNVGGGPNFRYMVNNGRIHTGLTVVSYALQDVSREDGGFACIPGSHKSTMPLSAEDRKSLMTFDGSLVQTIATPKGSAVIFTECLAHGAASWQHEVPRYGLFYKYNHRAAIYHCQEVRRPSAAALDAMSPAQRCYFNNAWEGFGSTASGRNDEPEF
jgi:hypothetical protein